MKKLIIFLIGLMILAVLSGCQAQEASVTPETSDSLPTSDKVLEPNLLVVVNSEIHPSIQSELTQYKADLENEGYTVQVISYSCETSNQLKETIRNHNPDGVFLIGDFPVVWFEIYPYTMEVEDGTYEYPSHTIFPTDLYYMDLDGTWIDSDGNGYFDEHTGDREPEVFFGRLTTGNLGLLGDELSVIKDYFRRNHQYRMGAMEVKDRALIYWCTEYDCGSFDRIREIYTTVDIFECRQIFAGGVECQGEGKGDFLQKLRGGYQFVMLGGLGHSGSNGVSMGGDYLTCSDLIDANPESQFYVIHSCLNSKYTDEDFIAGCFAYGGKGLIAIGTSSPGGGIGKGPAFYESLRAGKSFGGAMKDFFVFMISTDTPELYSNYRLATHCYSTILLGDPTLKIRK